MDEDDPVPVVACILTPIRGISVGTSISILLKNRSILLMFASIRDFRFAVNIGESLNRRCVIATRFSLFADCAFSSGTG